MITALQLYHLKSRDLLKQDNKGHACSTRQMLKGTMVTSTHYLFKFKG